MGRPTRDIAGQRFGRLVVIEDTDERVREGVVWLCQCDCGKKAKVRSWYLRSGQKSCRCCSHRQLQNPDAYKLSKSKRNAKYLFDGYVRSSLRYVGFKNEQITPELMELKRELMTLGRLERRLYGLISAGNQGVAADR